MKTVILSLSIIVLSIFNANSQVPDRLQLGAGFRFSTPSGNYAKDISIGGGIEVQAEMGLGKMVSGIVISGYSTFLGKKKTVSGITTEADPFGYIPLLAGIRFYPVNKLLLGAQAGYGILTGSGSGYSGFNYQTQIGYVTLDIN